MADSAAIDLALTDDSSLAGFLEPLVGRVALREVTGYYGFPLIKAGQTITPNIAEKALSLGRMFELTEATEPV